MQLAIEEFGKIVMLKDAFESSSTEFISVNNYVFTSHKLKTERAFSILNPELREIHTGGFGKGFFRGFDISTEVNHKTRLDCAFVDFIENSWFLGRIVDREKLEALIRNIEDNLLLT